MPANRDIIKSLLAMNISLFISIDVMTSLIPSGFLSILIKKMTAAGRPLKDTT
jgi:hypothetical protein